MYDWAKIDKVIVAGKYGFSSTQTIEQDGFCIRIVEYSSGYVADHWCQKGHIVFCIEGTFICELNTGESFIISKEMSFVVSDKQSSHRAISETGAKLLIIDGNFLLP
jgi:hypothetical protein